MTTVHEEVPAYSESVATSAFSRGENQAINNANILNASGNITYIECNPQLTQAIVDALLNVSSDPCLPGILPEVASTLTHTTTSSTALCSQPDLIGIPLQEDIIESPISENVDSDKDESRSVESSESETNVNMIPTHETLFLPSETLSRSPSDRQIYVEKMFPLNHGFPLWFPQPDRYLPFEYRRKGVSIGDVGVITPNGAFDFLFNISLPAEHPINPNDLPDDFSFIPKLRTLFQISLNPGTSAISNLDINSHFDENTNDIIFTCQDSNKGAILAIPDGASEEDLRNEWELKEFISKNALTWYRYARHCGLELDRRSLYLVTGHTKSKTWGIATFCKTVPERNSVLSISKSNPTSGLPFSWKKSGGATVFRTGPSPDPDFSENGMQTDTDNQCLFLRGFQISLSEDMWNKILGLTDGVTNKNSPEEYHKPGSTLKKSNCKDRTGSGAQSSCHKDFGNSISITKFPPRNTQSHPLNVINDMLFSIAPKAHIVVTHDSSWSKLVSQVRIRSY
ncbi:hypothetical protein BDQ17DRAFT_1073564 [Cyathus striatus]|nr:hypothetical protein BDQ17DRAFT_1073564 [Cyathus striatus]